MGDGALLVGVVLPTVEIDVEVDVVVVAVAPPGVD